MERRGFLKLLAGTAVATQIPAVLLPTEEKGGDYSVRYIRAYDVFNDRMVERVDVARGVELMMPKAIDNSQAIRKVTLDYVVRAIKTMKIANVPLEAIYALEANMPLKTGQIICVDFTR